ncbi:MAG: hypothetical protein H7Y03_15165 [Chitinophagaceae bacterium]|nr:hypothetical protein [Chitinophagaceae bacterium]
MQHLNLQETEINFYPHSVAPGEQSALSESLNTETDLDEEIEDGEGVNEDDSLEEEDTPVLDEEDLEENDITEEEIENIEWESTDVADLDDDDTNT